MRLPESLNNITKKLFPGYFASVMATGIVSIASFLTGHKALSDFLFIAANVFYVILILGYLLRLALFRKETWTDMTNAAKVFGYFTFVAGSDVLATRYSLAGDYQAALWLGVVALIAWTLMNYFILTFMVFYNEQPITKALNGTWLLATVSAQSLSIVSLIGIHTLPTHRSLLILLSVSFWAFGVVIYLIFIALIIYRYFFHVTKPSDMTPPYWINMGAMAITTLAGAHLVLAAPTAPILTMLQPFMEGFTILLWVWGTWWIPFLFIVGFWKYVLDREPVRYDPALWSMVFPLGMYTTACDTMSKIPGLGLIHSFVTVGLWIAIASWFMVAVLFLVKNKSSERQQSPQKAMR
ncbi:tellurite resistance/C4-dicarboxylate transporter family protein [Alicyclobacillus sp. SO9]|uniref:tellurite resistance/C4-dicarboxylate transporter family protein n=1 Tax=Alicyclobacillus sp. SO9 TaxID=2665646 RepID=UPI0018E7BB53|nr:tellurite resistance/C4-dicarboxylate transporter family protein [Alicyclobacillus sp. SO9]QQE80117.1 tellurite resistance/C4-dicarboxylate transporter family protein [Alicyclobacillus sp. SO9]